MLEIKVKVEIEAPGLVEAINNLVTMQSFASTTPVEATIAAVGNLTEAINKNAESGYKGSQQSTSTEGETEKKEDKTPATVVPTSAPQYTLEMISNAGTALIDAGKMSDLMALLGKYGIEALTALDPAQYGAFATDLRAIGAAI